MHAQLSGERQRKLIFYVNILNQKHISCDSWKLFLILLYCGPCPSGIAHRVMNRKQTLGKPDQRDLNENLAATHGLAHMIQECRKLFRVSICQYACAMVTLKYTLCCNHACLHICIYFLNC